MTTQEKSYVELLYERLQKETEGDIIWHDLHPQHQHMFVEAVNVIIQMTATKRQQYFHEGQG